MPPFSKTPVLRLQIALVVNPLIPGDEIHGFNENGQPVCAVTYKPVFQFLKGTATTQDEAVTWHANAQCAVRMNAIAEWVTMGRPVAGHA